MPTINGHFISGSGADLATSIEVAIIGAPYPSADGASVVSRGRFKVTTDGTGNVTFDAEPGQYTLTWLDGTATNVCRITVPNGAGPYDLPDIIEPDPAVSPAAYASILARLDAVSAAAPQDFATIAAMSAAADGSFTIAITFNSFAAGDGVLGLWYILASGDSPLPANGDSRISLAGGTYIGWRLNS